MSPQPNYTPPVYRIRHANPSDVRDLDGIERSAGEVFRTVGLDAVADNEPLPAELLQEHQRWGLLWVAVALGGERSDGQKYGAAASEDGDAGVTSEYEEVVGFLACFPLLVEHRDIRGGDEEREPERRMSRPDAEAVEEEGESGAAKAASLHSTPSNGEPTVYLHIAELSVHASHQKRGLGKRLLQTMFEEIAKGKDITVPSQTMFAEMAKEEDIKVPPGDDDEDETNETLHAHANPSTTDQSQSTRHLCSTDCPRTARVVGYSLTTFQHLAFNAPFYKRMGFQELPVAEIESVVGVNGKKLWIAEQAHITLPEKRCWMVREL